MDCRVIDIDVSVSQSVVTNLPQVRTIVLSSRAVWLCEMPAELLAIYWIRIGVAFPGKNMARSREIAERKITNSTKAVLRSEWGR